ncbi:RepB family plasmid replication initiator protein [Pedobacter petrophilus]|uniref:RepB family plasmid replication initiator protein n=1 Tax=Pedobacter petrophilus TaxID=1908241 RepID=UPI00362AFFE0
MNYRIENGIISSLERASQDIGSRMFEIETTEKYIQLWLFKSFTYHTGKGYFTVAINDKARPYFFELKTILPECN